MTPPRPQAPPGTWCAVPVYNNGATAIAVARACRSQVPHVVVVDDGSTDVSLSALLAGSDITVLRHEGRQGKGAALQTALAHVASHGGRTLITLDGDGQHLPEDIPRLFPLMEETPDALVIGCRDMTGPHVPRSSRFGRAFSNLWVFLETGLRLPDTQSGFRAYPVPQTSALRLGCRHFDFEIEVLVRAAWSGLSIRSVPVRVFYPPAPQRVSHFHKWRDNLRLSRLHARLVLRRLWPAPQATPEAAPPRPDAPRPIRTRKRGNRLGFWFFAVATRFTGLRGAYGLLYFVCLHYLLFDRAAVSAALAYLRRRFPGRSRVHLLLDVYRLFISQGRCLIDRHAALAGMPFDVRFERGEELRALGSGFILLLAHVGNWQLALGALGNMDRPVCLLMRPEDSRAVADYLKVSHAGAGLRIVSPESPFGGVIELVRHVTEGSIVCMMGDRGYQFPATPVRFLGDTAHFPVGAFRIAAAASCPVAFLFARRSGYRRYDLEAPIVCRPVFREGADRVAQTRDWAQSFASAVEDFAVRHPYQVFLFHDVWAPVGGPESRRTEAGGSGRGTRVEGLAGGNAT